MRRQPRKLSGDTAFGRKLFPSRPQVGVPIIGTGRKLPPLLGERAGARRAVAQRRRVRASFLQARNEPLTQSGSWKASFRFFECIGTMNPVRMSLASWSAAALTPLLVESPILCRHLANRSIAKIGQLLPPLLGECANIVGQASRLPVEAASSRVFDCAQDACRTGRRDARPTQGFMESPLSIFRMHWDHEPRSYVACVLECGGLDAAFGGISYSLPPSCEPFHRENRTIASPSLPRRLSGSGGRGRGSNERSECLLLCCSFVGESTLNFLSFRIPQSPIRNYLASLFASALVSASDRLLGQYGF